MRINEVKNLRDIKLFYNELRLKSINSNKPRNIFVDDKTEFYIDHTYFTRRGIDRLAINPLPNDPVSGSVSYSKSIQQLSDPEHR